MNMKILLVLSIIAATILVVSCASQVPKEQQCTADTDCTAAICCHSDSAVNNDYAPDCGGILCSADCQAGTMDCGQAAAKCVQGACTVVDI